MIAETIRPLAAAIDRDRIERARRQSPESKFMDSLRLHDEVVAHNKSGIRHQFPDADEARVHEILLERLARLRRAHEHHLYCPVEDLAP